MVSKIKDIALNMFCNVSEFAKKNIRALLCLCLCVAFAFSTLVVGKSVNTFKISDGNAVKTVKLLTDDVEEAVKTIGLTSKDYQILNTSKKNGVIDVSIGYTFPVRIVTGEKIIDVKTAKTTVAGVLKLVGIDVDDYDLIEPTADTVINEECTINYSNIDFVTGSYTEAIPCSLETEYSAEKMRGENTVIQGTDGQKQVYYTSKIVNGQEVETVVNKVVVLSNAVNGKQIIGTAVPKATSVTTSEQIKSVSTLKPQTPIELDANGNPVSYTKKLTVQATGYTYTGRRCATGVTPQPGYIAVNPKYIPYGTKMYIKSADGSYTYGYAVAADTGGFTRTRPTNVDLFFASRSAAVAFGRRNVEIYIIG